MRSWLGGLAFLGVLTLCLPATAADGLTSRPDGSDPAAATAGGAPASGPGSAGRIAANFLTLMGQNWKDIALFAGRLALWAVVWALLMFPAGLAAGLLAWLAVRHVGLLDARWNWYRYVRWLWAVLFILGAGVGFAYGGAWLGMGRTLKDYILRQRMVDKVVGHLVLASALDSADYRARGADTIEQMDRVLADSQAVADAALADFKAVEDELLAEANFAERWMLRLAIESLSERSREELLGMDPRFLLVYLASPDLDRYMAEHPDAHPALMGISLQLQAVRHRAWDVANGFIAPHVHGGLWGGLLGPVVLAICFRILVGLTDGRRTGPIAAVR